MERKLLALLANLPDSGISLFSKRNMNGTSHNRYDCLKPTESLPRILVAKAKVQIYYPSKCKQ